jgi:hypothetical protein
MNLAPATDLPKAIAASEMQDTELPTLLAQSLILVFTKTN